MLNNSNELERACIERRWAARFLSPILYRQIEIELRLINFTMAPNHVMHLSKGDPFAHGLVWLGTYGNLRRSRGGTSVDFVHAHFCLFSLELCTFCKKSSLGFFLENSE
jgi:hypothetical protein